MGLEAHGHMSRPAIFSFLKGASSTPTFFIKKKNRQTNTSLVVANNVSYANPDPDHCCGS
jgi:hypothetical protein